VSDTNWLLVRSDYENGMSLRKLEAKYGIAKSVIGKRKFEEKWSETGRTQARTLPKNPETTTRDINAAVRVHMAIKLFLEERPTWDEIAARTGYSSRGAAHNAVMHELSRCITHDVKELRTQELYRIEQLQARSYKEATDKGNPAWTWATDRFVALSKRKSELMGMDVKPDDALAANMVVIREVPQGLLPEPNA
jgi:hypothetical protein